MWWYVGKRVLQTIPVIIFSTLIIYALVFLRPGDPIVGLFGEKPVSDAVRAQIESQYNLDKPFIVQWMLFLKDVAQLDFGTSFSGQPVGSLVARAFPVTITLALMALIFQAVFGLLIGTIAGLKRGGWFDTVTLLISLGLIAIPIFVVAFVFQFFVGVKAGVSWLPPTVGGEWTLNELLIPAVVLGIVQFAFVLRLTRTSVGENMSADHVRTARAKGMPERLVIRNHVLRNSMIPVVTYLGIELGSLMAGAVVTEGIFNIPGVGNLAFRSIQKGETPTVVSVITIFVLIYVFMNLLVDLLYAVLDPRIRYE